MSWDRDDLLRSARNAEASGDLASAVASLKKALDIDASDAATWAWLGSLDNEREQYTTAVEDFGRAIQLHGQLAGAYSGMAVALEALGRLEEAERALRTSIRLRPSAARYVLLGDVQASLLREADAEASFRAALSLDAENEEALVNLAVTIRPRGREEAIALLKRAIRADPGSARAHRELGWELFQLGNLTQAEESLTRAVEIDAEDAWTRIYLAHVHQGKGDLPKAETELQQATVLAPLWSLPHVLLGKIYDELGQPERAEEHLRTAVLTDPSDADALYELGRVLLAAGKREEAKRWLAEALKVAPDHAAAIRTLATLS
ncbi:MAG: tetratricopeptide repeat protein [Gemmatimonadaceae bacterium]